MTTTDLKELPELTTERIATAGDREFVVSGDRVDGYDIRLDGVLLGHLGNGDGISNYIAQRRRQARESLARGGLRA